MGEEESAPSTRLGPWAERLAERFLIDRDYTIVTRNYRTREGEIDLVAARNDCLVFVEVKARAGIGYGKPVEAVDFRKRGKLRRAAAAFLADREHGDRRYDSLRFDVVSVVAPPGGTEPIVEHIVAAF